MATEFPKRAVDTDAPPPANLTALFSPTPERVALEIGFGGGEHLIAGARREPTTGFIGVEPFVSGMASALAGIIDAGIGNVRLFGGEASMLLDWLPTASLDLVDILYPDPWPKKRHWKRRFITPENLDRVARVLRPGGILRFVSDIPSYVEWTLALMVKRREFDWTAERATDWTRPFAGWPGTRFETKALKAGRIPTYLGFRRV